MNNCDRISHIKLSLTKWLVFISSFLIFGNNCASIRGQIVPDDTLSNESSQVRDDLTIDNLPAKLIEGGAQRDSNLFHSFSQFNVEAGRGAYFANPQNITHIFSRVTGGNVSEIMGRLGVQGNANLFLINPNGIIFGENSSLDVNGSFVGSSADSVVFGNDFEFSAVNPKTPPLLIVNQPLGLNLGNNPGEIVNNSITDNVGLQVLPGRNVSLIGGNITLNRGIITAPGGTVELSGLATTGFVAIDKDNNFDFPQEVAKADVTLTSGAVVDVRADGGGFVKVNARNIELVEDSILISGISGSSNAQAGDITLNASETISLQRSAIGNQVDSDSIGNSGDINLNTRSLSATDGSVISTDTFGQGDGGLVSIQASDTVELSRISIFSDVNSSAQGNAGGIEINTGSLSMSDEAIVSSSVLGQGDGGLVTIQASDNVELSGMTILSQVFPEAQGNSGKIEIDTGSLSINASILETSNVGRGNAGSIDINSSDRVSIEGSLVRSLLGSPIEGSNSGGININTESLLVTDNAELNSSLINGGKGSAGNIAINVNDKVTFDGGFARSRLEKGAEGNGGDILIDTGSLLATGLPPEIADARTGQLTTATFGVGDAGDVIINATGDVSFDGRGSDIFSLVALDEGIGNGGNIEINSSSLSINNQARLIATNEAFGNAGDIIINTDSVSVANGGQLDTNTADKDTDLEIARSRDGGNIEINTRSFIANNGVFNASSLGTGNAGNIIITASESASLDKGTNISARTLREGAGGNITINANQLKLENSLIDVSTFGIGNAGTITINATESLEISGFGLARLQAEFINPALANPVLIQNIFSLENFGNINPSTIQGIIAFTSGQGEAGGIEINAPRLNISNGSIIGTSSFADGTAGAITIKAPDLLEINSANITASTFGMGDAGDLEIDTGKLSISNGGQIDATTVQSGSGGNLTIRATELVELKGVFENNNLVPSSLLIGAQREETTGNGGDLQLDTPQLVLSEGGQINATAQGQGDGGNIQLEIADLLLLRNNSQISTTASSQSIQGGGGNIKIDTNRLEIENSLIDASTLGTGNAGTITINATESVEVTGFGFARLQETVLAPAVEDISIIENIFSSGNVDIFNTSIVQGILAITSGQGEAGGIEINTPRLSVFDGSIIGTASIREGAAGAIDINVAELLEINQAIVSVSTLGSGNAGDIEINTGKLLINNGGQIAATTLGIGNGGNLTVNASEIVELTGVFENNVVPSSSLLVGSQRAETTGNGGDLQITTPQLRVSDGAAITATTLGQGDGGNIQIDITNDLDIVNNGSISVNSQGQGNAGELNIRANSLFLVDNSQLLANTVSSEGGNIQLEIADLLLLGGNSGISTTAGGGNGGNVDIDTDFVVAFPSENSDITANAFQGRGGAIQISTQGIFGIESRQQLTPLNDITAFSQQNPQLDGTIAIEAPDTDLNREFISLPENFIDVASLVVPVCPRDNTASAASEFSEFIVTGRGGLPPEPEDNFRLPAIAVGSNSPPTEASSYNSQLTPQPIVEATRWIRNTQGKIVLVASPATAATPNSLSNPAKCNL